MASTDEVRTVSRCKLLGQLAPPSFVLFAPRWLQYAALTTAVATLGAAIALVVHDYNNGDLGIVDVLLGGIAFVMLIVLLQPRSWKRHDIFAADRDGIYVTRDLKAYAFIPWSRVGESYVGGLRKEVFFEIKATNPEWELIVGGHIPGLGARVDSKGYRSLNIGNAARRPERVQSDIEKIRPRQD